MTCPRCQMSIANPSAAFCPHCGYAFQPPQPDVSTPSVPQTEAPFTPPAYPPPPAYPTPVSPQMPMGSYPGYGMPPSGGPFSSGMPSSPYPPSPYPPSPYPPSAYPPYPPYPPYPVYPPYTFAAPGTVPLAPPAWAPAAPSKRRSYALVGLLVLLLVAVVAGGSAALYLVANGQHGATISIAPTPTPGSITLLQDPLTYNAYGWASDSHCFFSDGSYHVKAGYVCFAPMSLPSLQNGEVSVQMKQVAGQTDWFDGLKLRWTKGGNAYGFVITSNGYWKFDKFVNGQRSDVVASVRTTALRIGSNVSNTLDVRMMGAKFTFYINGQRVGQATDDTFVSGKVGLSANSQGGVEVAFNNFDASMAA